MLLVFAPSFIFSQETTIGITAGYTNSGIKTNHPYLKNISRDNNLNTGIIFDYGFSKLISIRTGVNYDQKGFADNITFTDAQGNILGDSKLHFDFNYLTIPVLLKFTIGDKYRVYGNVGLFGSYILSAGVFGPKYNSNGKESGDELLMDEKNHVNKIDYGMILGFGVEYKIKTKFIIGIDARFNQSFNNIDTKDFFPNYNMINNSFNINITFRYILNKRNK